MRRTGTDPLTLALISAVTLLIWYWAAGETRDTQNIPISVGVEIAGDEPFRVDPPTIDGNAELEGSRSSLRAARAALATLALDLPATESGEIVLDVAAVLAEHPEIRATGVTVVSADPPRAEVDVERLVSATATVVPRLRGVTTAGPPLVEPAEVRLVMPQWIRDLLPSNPTVEPVLVDRRLELLEPGRRQRLTAVPVRLVGYSGPLDEVRFEPALVTVELEVESQTVELALPRPVRVNLLVAPEDDEVVTVEPSQLRDVHVRVRRELLPRIESGEAIVLAQLHLKSREREARIESKRIGGFVVVRPDGVVEKIEGWVDDGTAIEPRPEIDLRIRRRDERP